MDEKANAQFEDYLSELRREKAERLAKMEAELLDGIIGERLNRLEVRVNRFLGCDDEHNEPHLAEAFDILCGLVQEGTPVPVEIVVLLEDDNELTWKTEGLLDAIKRRISASA